MEMMMDWFPPRIAPKQIVIIPVVPKPELEAEVFAYADKSQRI